MMGVPSAYRNTLSVYKRGKVVIQMKKVYAVNICVLIVMFLTAGAAAIKVEMTYLHPELSAFEDEDA